MKAQAEGLGLCHTWKIVLKPCKGVSWQGRWTAPSGRVTWGVPLPRPSASLYDTSLG